MLEEHSDGSPENLITGTTKNLETSQKKIKKSRSLDNRNNKKTKRPEHPRLEDQSVQTPADHITLTQKTREEIHRSTGLEKKSRDQKTREEIQRIRRREKSRKLED